MRDENGRNTGQESKNRRAVTHDDVKPPVPMHHRLKLGQTDGTSNPYGSGNVSTVPTAKKPNVPGW